MDVAEKKYESRINVLKEECQAFFDLIYKILNTHKVTNEDKVRLNIIEHEGRDWMLSFEKHNHNIMNTMKFQEEIDLQLYDLLDELNIIKTRLHAISDKYE